MNRASIFMICFLSVVRAKHSARETFHSQNDDCLLPDKVLNEIKSYKWYANQMHTTYLNKYKGQYYQSLLNFVDTFGGRLAGSENNEKAIDYLIQFVRDNYYEMPWTESFDIPHWKRGNEMAEIINPQRKKLDIIGLGFAGNTPPEGISADVVVVSNFTELEELGSKVKNKIVLFNANFTSYHETVIYRTQGPARASKLGAIAALVRSVTPFSIYSLHTGVTNFGECDKEIPAAAVTLEDADYMARIYKKTDKTSESLKVWLKMDARVSGTFTTRNVIFKRGGSYDNKFVVISGHTDSWDIGQGALQDGAGAFFVIYTMLALYEAGFNTDRTIKAILFGGGKLGHLGAEDYKAKHWDEINAWNAAFQADAGIYDLLGFNTNGNFETYCILKEIAALVDNSGVSQINYGRNITSDISVFQNYSIPLIEPLHRNSNYYWFHNSAGDTASRLNSDDMDKNVAMTAVMVYVTAGLSFPLPRGNESLWTNQDNEY